MLVHKTEIRVRYADTDKMQFVYNGKYLEYFEVGRTEMLRATGLPYSEVEINGFQLPLVEAGIRYKAPARYDDILEIESRVQNNNSAKIHINYTITRKETGELIAEGFTDHLFMNIEKKKAARPPKFYLDALAPFFN